MRKGFSLVELLVIVAIVLVVLAIVIGAHDKYQKPQEMVVTGWVRAVDLYDRYAVTIAFEREEDITPIRITIEDRHPELWQGEHVSLTLRRINQSDTWQMIGFRRLGPDAPPK